MKVKWLWAAMSLSLTTWAAAQTSPPEIPYESVPDFFKLPANVSTISNEDGLLGGIRLWNPVE